MATAQQLAKQVSNLRKLVADRERREAEAKRSEQGAGTVNVEAWLQHPANPTATRIVEREQDKPTAHVLRMLIVPRDRYVDEDGEPIPFFVPDHTTEPVTLPNGIVVTPVKRGPNLLPLMSAPMQTRTVTMKGEMREVRAFIGDDGTLNLDLSKQQSLNSEVAGPVNESVSSIRDTPVATFEHQTIDLAAKPDREDHDSAADKFDAIENDLAAMRSAQRDDNETPEIDAYSAPGREDGNETPNDAPDTTNGAPGPLSPETLALRGAEFYAATGMTKEMAKRRRIEQLTASRMSSYAAMQQAQKEGY